MKRRAVLLSTASLVALSGCFGSSQEEKAEQSVEMIDENLSVESWELNGDSLQVRYQTTGSLSTDLERIAMDYADAVDDGLEADLEATATGASNEFTFSIEQELAEQYLNDEIEAEEYIDQIV